MFFTMTKMRLGIVLLTVFSVPLVFSQDFAGLAPISIEIPAPVVPEGLQDLEVPLDYWILVGTVATIDSDGLVVESTARRGKFSRLVGTGNFDSRNLVENLPSFDCEPFRTAALTALDGARFESRKGAPYKSFINFAWRVGALKTPSSKLVNIRGLRDGESVLARTFAKGTSFYLWKGVGESVETSFAPFEPNPDALGYPSLDFLANLEDCQVVTHPLVGYTEEQLDSNVRSLEPLQVPYPQRERRLRVTGTVVLQIRIDKTGRVSAVHLIRAVPGFPGFAESTIATVCDLRYQVPRRDGLPVPAVHTIHSSFRMD